MADYVIQLSDGREVELSSDKIAKYPHIQDQVGDISGNTLILSYPDAEALYLALTTDLLEPDHNLDMYIRLIGAIDYLGNDDLTNNMVQKFLTWLDDPDKLANLKRQKQNIKDVMGKLSVTTLWKFVELYHKKLQLQYISKQGEINNFEVSSPNLDYTMALSSPDWLSIFNRGQEIARIKPSIVTNKMAIADNGDVYIIENLLGKMEIYKFNLNNILNSISNESQLIGQIWGDTSNIHLASDGTKYMTQSDFEGIIKYKIYDINYNSFSGDVPIEGLSGKREQLTSYPSPRMTVIIGQDIDGNDYKYFIHRLDTKSISYVQKPSSPHGIFADPVYIIPLYFHINNNHRLYNNRILILFSYDEKIYMEVTTYWLSSVTSIPTIQTDCYLLPMITNVPKENYIVRILDINGNILVKQFTIKELPVALSDKYFLTIIRLTKTIQHNNKYVTIEEDCVIVRDVNKLNENIIDVTKPPNPMLKDNIIHVIEPPNPILKDNVVEYDIRINIVIPGPNESFLFVYNIMTTSYKNNRFVVENIGEIVVKYQYIPYKNVEELLDHKLE